MSGPLDREKLLKLFDELSTDLRFSRTRAQIYIVGGAAMSLAFDRERTTRDVDARIDAGHSRLAEAVREVGRRHGLGDTCWCAGCKPRGRRRTVAPVARFPVSIVVTRQLFGLAPWDLAYNPAAPAMSHLESFRAIHYRGIDGVSLEHVVAVNLVTGPNGAGKTSLAEAIWLFNGRFAPRLLWDAHVQRSQYVEVDPLDRLVSGAVELAGTERGSRHEWKAVFERVPTMGGATADSDQRAALSAKPSAVNGPPWPVLPQGRLRVWLDGDEAGLEHRILGEVQGEGVCSVPVVPRPASHKPAVIHLPGFSLDMDDETIRRFSALVAQGRKDYVKSTLRLVLPLLADVEVITDHNGKPFILATTTENERLPLQALGGGLTRLFRMFVAFHDHEGGLVVIDEIENGLHYLVLPKLWCQIQAMTVELDVQVFATTHSRECIDAALDAFSDQPGRLAVHVLSRHGDGVRAVTYSGETLEAARDLNLDLR